MNLLDAEARCFGRYLLGQTPNDYAVAKYRYYHDTLRSQLGDQRVYELPDQPGDRIGDESGGSGDRFDRFLLGVARRHPWLTRMADAYGRFFRPRGLLRKKLVLLLAILESCHPSHKMLDSVDPCGLGDGSVRLAFRMGLSLFMAGLSLVAGLLLLAPAHFCFKLANRTCRRKGSLPQKHAEPAREKSLQRDVLAAAPAGRPKAVAS